MIAILGIQEVMVYTVVRSAVWEWYCQKDRAEGGRIFFQKVLDENLQISKNCSVDVMKCTNDGDEAAAGRKKE